MQDANLRVIIVWIPWHGFLKQLGKIFVRAQSDKSDAAFFCHGKGGERMSALEILFTHSIGWGRARRTLTSLKGVLRWQTFFGIHLQLCHCSKLHLALNCAPQRCWIWIKFFLIGCAVTRSSYKPHFALPVESLCVHVHGGTRDSCLKLKSTCLLRNPKGQ